MSESELLKAQLSPVNSTLGNDIHSGARFGERAVVVTHPVSPRKASIQASERDYLK